MSKQVMEMARKTLQDLYASFVDSVEGGPADELMQDTMTAIEALKEAIKQQGEPVAIYRYEPATLTYGIEWLIKGSLADRTPLYTSAPPIPEEVETLRQRVKELEAGAATVNDFDVRNLAALEAELTVLKRKVELYEAITTGYEHERVNAVLQSEPGTSLFTSAPSIPEGWQLVNTLTVTADMVRAGRDVWNEDEAFMMNIKNVFKAMIAAAPSYKGEQS